MSPVKTLKAITKTAVIIMISAVVVVAGAVTAMVVLNVGKELYRVVKMFELNGSADVERASAGTISAYAGMNLENGDTLYVKENSSARISLDSDKYITLDQNTVMELVAEGNESDSLTKLNLSEGTILNEITQPLSGNSVYEVNTPKATMAVRGTSYSVKVIKIGNEYLTELNVFHGNVAVQLYDEEGNPKGDPVLVPEGKRVNIITEPNEKSGKDPALDGNSFFVFVDEEGNITPCGNSDPVTDIIYSGISDVILKQLLSSHNEKTLILSTEIAENILIAIENSNSDSDVSEFGTTTESSVFEKVTTVSESGSDEPTVTTVPEEYTQTDNYSEITWVTTQTSFTETTTVTTVPQSEETEEETTVTASESEETTVTTEETTVKETDGSSETKATNETKETKHTTTAPYTTGSSGYTTTYTVTSATSFTTVTSVTSETSLTPFTSETEETTETTETELIPIDDAEVTLEYTSTVYNGKAQKPAVTVKLDGAALGAGTDYTVSYANNKNAGTATVTVTGCGDYTGSASAAFIIEKADPDIGTVSVKNEKVFTSTSPADIILVYTNTDIKGTLKLDTAVTKFNVGENDCGWIFTPADTTNYNSITGSIVINAVVAEAVGIIATPEKSSKEYTYGTDTFDLAAADIVIKLEYEDGSTEDITDLAVFDPNFTIGQTEVEISYDGFTCSVGVDIYYTVNYTAKYTASYAGTFPDEVLETAYGMIGYSVVSPIAPSIWSIGSYDPVYAVMTKTDSDGNEIKYLLYKWDGATIVLDEAMLDSTGTYTVEVPYVPADSIVEVTITKDGNTVSADLVEKDSSYTLPGSSENGFKGWGVYQSGGWYGTKLNPGASGGTNTSLNNRRQYDCFFYNAGESITIDQDTELFEVYVYTVTFHNSDGTVLSTVETLGGETISNTAYQTSGTPSYQYQYVKSALSAAPELYTADIDGRSYGTAAGNYQWVDSGGNVFDENTVVTGDIDVYLTLVT